LGADKGKEKEKEKETETEKEKWGKLTDGDLDVINGRREQLEGKIQQRYGFGKDQIQKDIDDWYSSQKCH
jgi:uncharacterized protein YjbJ (UPF0337 family)